MLQPLNLLEFCGHVHAAVVIRGVLRIEVLVVAFCVVELAERDYLGDDLTQVLEIDLLSFNGCFSGLLLHHTVVHDC